MRYSNLGPLPQKEANYRDLEGTDLKPCPPRGEWRPQDAYLGRGRGAKDSTILVFKYKGLGGWTRVCAIPEATENHREQILAYCKENLKPLLSSRVVDPQVWRGFRRGWKGSANSCTVGELRDSYIPSMSESLQRYRAPSKHSGH